MFRTILQTLTIALTFFLATSLSLTAQAEDEAAAETSLKVEDVREGDNQPPGGDIDRLITNKKMRAESGSKSQYSLSIGLGYNGGSLEKPLDERRPNIGEGTGSTDVATLGGSVSGKYAITSTKAILAGAGMRWITPFNSSDTPTGYNGEKFDADNPYAIYQYVYKWWGVQSVVQAQGTYFTATNLVRDGYVATFGLSQNNAYLFPGTGFTLGLFAYTGYGYFDDDRQEVLANQSDYSFGFIPFMEYAITDRVNVRTGSNLWVFQHVRSLSAFHTYNQQKITQNVGLGIAVTRDFFLSPGIDFILDDIRSDRTTVSLGANINLF